MKIAGLEGEPQGPENEAVDSVPLGEIVEVWKGTADELGKLNQTVHLWLMVARCPLALEVEDEVDNRGRQWVAPPSVRDQWRLRPPHGPTPPVVNQWRLRLPSGLTPSVVNQRRLRPPTGLAPPVVNQRRLSGWRHQWSVGTSRLAPPPPRSRRGMPERRDNGGILGNRPKIRSKRLFLAT